MDKRSVLIIMNLKVQQRKSHDGPFLIDFKIKKEENVFPMIPSGKVLIQLLEPIDGSNQYRH